MTFVVRFVGEIRVGQGDVDAVKARSSDRMSIDSAIRQVVFDKTESVGVNVVRIIKE